MHSRDEFRLISCIGTLWDDIRSAARASTVLRRCKVLLDAIMKSALRRARFRAPIRQCHGRRLMSFDKRTVKPTRPLDLTIDWVLMPWCVAVGQGQASSGRPPSPSGGEDLLVLGRGKG